MTAPLAMRVLVRSVDERAREKAESLPLLSVSQSRGVIPRSEIDDSAPRAADLAIYKLCKPGDIILNRMSAYKGAVGLASVEGLISPDYLVLRPTPLANARFLTYLIKSPWFVDEMAARVRGIGSIESGLVRTPRIGERELGEIRVPVLDCEHQSAIADYLDHETAEIDAFIADQKELIALLEERRRSVITELVTKSAGDESWQLTTIGRTFRVLDCKHITAVTGSTGHYPVASIREVGGEFVNLDFARRTTRDFFEVLTEGGRQPRQGDLIISRNASIGKVAMVPGSLPDFALGQDVSLIRQSSAQARTDFLQYVLRSAVGTSAFERASIGSTFKRINVDDIKAVRYQLPDAVTQSARVRKVAEALPPLDAAIADAREAIALSKERRAALISAAVTGQIDVTEKKRVLV